MVENFLSSRPPHRAIIEEETSDESRSDTFLTYLLLASIAAFTAILLPITFEIALHWHQFTLDNSITHLSRSAVPSSTTIVSVDKTNLSNIQALFPYLSASGLLVGFLATLVQLRIANRQNIRYRQQELRESKLANDQHSLALTAHTASQQWRKSQFIAEQIRIFSEDRSVKNVKLILEAIDSGKQARLFLTLVDPTNPDSVKSGPLTQCELFVTPQQILNALTPEVGQYLMLDIVSGKPSERHEWTVVENKVAYEIDEFVTYILQFKKFENDGILLNDDLMELLQYWFELIFPKNHIAEFKRAPNAPNNIMRRQLHRYLLNYYEPDACVFLTKILKINKNSFKVSSELECSSSCTAE